MTGHGVCCVLPTAFHFHTAKGTWLVELAWYTNSADEMVQNSGTTSSHMSFGDRCQHRDKQHLAVSCVPAWGKCTCFDWEQRVKAYEFLLLSLTVFVLLNTHKSHAPSHCLFRDVIKCFSDAQCSSTPPPSSLSYMYSSQLLHLLHFFFFFKHVNLPDPVYSGGNTEENWMFPDRFCMVV